MVAQKKEEVPKDEKSELDLGIEESIRRCEALLSMVPISLQPILADGAFRRTSSKKDVAEPEFESKMAALEPEWTKNMGLLSGIKDQKSNASTLEESETHTIDISISSEVLSEKPPHQTPQIPKPPKSKDNSSVASQQADYVSMQGGVRGPKEEIFLKKIHIKRRCSRSSDASSTASASEDWTIDFTQAAESSTTSMSGTQDDRSVEESKEEGDVEEIDTRKAGMSRNSDTSRSSCRSFEALCFTITAPQHCEEAWEWLDKRSVENISPSDLNYEERKYNQSSKDERGAFDRETDQ